MSEIQAQFEEAVVNSKSIPSKPDNETLLTLYALYKQATDGSAPEKVTYAMFDFVAKAKHEAWSKIKDYTPEQAMQEYIDLVNTMSAK